MMAAAGAFTRWRDFAEETLRHRDVCSRVASRILNRVKLGAFTGWLGFVETMRREKECFERVKALPERRLARFGWTSWREAYALRLKMRRTMKMLMNSSTVRVMRAWHAHVNGIKEDKNAASKALGFLLNRTIAGAFARWYAGRRRACRAAREDAQSRRASRSGRWSAPSSDGAKP